METTRRIHSTGYHASAKREKFRHPLQHSTARRDVAPRETGPARVHGAPPRSCPESSVRDERRDDRGWRRGEQGRVSARKEEKVVDADGGEGCTAL